MTNYDETKFEEDYFKGRRFEDKTYYMVQQWLAKTKPTTAYDYGCGEGFVVHACNYLGVECHGFDISKYATSHAYGMSAGKIGTNCANSQYDLVMCLDVMEHLDINKEQEILDKLAQLSKKWLLLSICDTLLSKRYIDKTHINIKPRAYWRHQLEWRGFKQVEIPSDWLFGEQLYLYEKK